MPLLIDLDSLSKKNIANLPPFIGLREIGKSKAELLFSEDAEYIVQLFKKEGDVPSFLLSVDYWRTYDSSCTSRISLDKVLKSVSGKKRKKGYYHKYDLRKMTTCPHGHKCPDSSHVCRRINQYTVAGAYVCGCRAPVVGYS